MQAVLPSSALRDPAMAARWGSLLIGAVLLWPLLVWTEFKPWELFDARSLKSTGKFLSSFVPPRHDDRNLPVDFKLRASNSSQGLNSVHTSSGHISTAPNNNALQRLVVAGSREGAIMRVAATGDGAQRQVMLRVMSTASDAASTAAAAPSKLAVNSSS